MYDILMGYLSRLPGALQEQEVIGWDSKPTGKRCRYVFILHSMRVTTATLLLDAGVPIEWVQELLDHKHITTTQIYDERRRSVRDSASRSP
jgi:integrase